jgi:hypothetical protein
MRPAAPLSLALLALALLACDIDAPTGDPSTSSSTDTGTGCAATEAGLDASTETTAGSTPIPSCCSCVDGELDCSPSSSPAECDALTAASGNPSIPLDCQLLEGGEIDCPSIDCTPPAYACCECIGGVSECSVASPFGCPNGMHEGCTIDILGEIDCGLVC